MSEVTQEQLFENVEEAPKEEGAILYSTGRVKVWFTDDSGDEPVRHEWNMRLPKLGEYRRFRTLFTSIGGVDFEEQERQVVEWMRDVFKALCRHQPLLPEDEDVWPMWFTTGFFHGALLNHWQNVPLAHGANVVGAKRPTLTLPSL